MKAPLSTIEGEVPLCHHCLDGGPEGCLDVGNKERWKRFRDLPPDIEPALGQLTDLFKQENVQLAYLFGSLGKGEQGHDVDLALLTEDQLAFRLREAITRRLGTERVDLVDLNRAPPVLRFEILRTGTCLYAVDDLTVEQFELETLREYRDTHPLRSRQRKLLEERMSR